MRALRASQLTLSIQTVKLSNAFKNRIFIRNNLKLELIEVSYLIVGILQDEKKRSIVKMPVVEIDCHNKSIRNNCSSIIICVVIAKSELFEKSQKPLFCIPL